MNLEQTDTVRAFAREMVLGLLMTAMMKQFRSLEKPWSKLPATHQATVLKEVQADVEEALYGAVDLIASDNRTRFRAKVDQVVFKDGVKAVLLMGNDESSHELADVTGGTVLVVIEDPARYIGGGNVPAAEADQRELLAN